MCTDSLGGVFVTWQDKRGGIDDDIYGTHVSSDHEIINPGSGVPIVVEGGNQVDTLSTTSAPFWATAVTLSAEGQLHSAK